MLQLCCNHIYVLTIVKVLSKVNSVLFIILLRITVKWDAEAKELAIQYYNFAQRTSFLTAARNSQHELHFQKTKRPSRSSQRRCSVRKSFLGNFAKFTGKHLCQSLFLNKVARNFSKNTFFTEHLWSTASGLAVQPHLVFQCAFSSKVDVNFVLKMYEWSLIKVWNIWWVCSLWRSCKQQRWSLPKLGSFNKRIKSTFLILFGKQKQIPSASEKHQQKTHTAIKNNKPTNRHWRR